MDRVGEQAIMRGEAAHLSTILARSSVDLVFGSPPYAMKGRRYGKHAEPFADVSAWVTWMRTCTLAALTVVKPGGLVLWVVNDPVHGGRHHPAVAMLQGALYADGVQCERPVIWHKNSPPNRRDWFVNDWETVLAFVKPGGDRYFDWQAIAEAPRYTRGGAFRQRDSNGRRRRGGAYPRSKLARPRDVIRCLIGGGHLGHKLAHANEAPFPLTLAETFVRSCCPPGGIVCDPFCGSGTTGHAAMRHGRRSILIDNRASQCALTRKRLAAVQSALASKEPCHA